MRPLNWGFRLFESALIILTAFRDDPPPSPPSVDAPRFSTSVETKCSAGKGRWVHANSLEPGPNTIFFSSICWRLWLRRLLKTSTMFASSLAAFRFPVLSLRAALFSARSTQSVNRAAFIESNT